MSHLLALLLFLVSLSAFSDAPSSEKQATLDALVAQQKGLRLNSPIPNLKRVETENASLLENYVTNVFQNFSGAEVPNSPPSNAMIDDIKKIQAVPDAETNALIQTSLIENLKDYQALQKIVGEVYTVRPPELLVTFKNASMGFAITKARGTPTRVLFVEKLTANHVLVRIEKPDNITVAAGSPLNLGLKIKAGGVRTRVLSLASSPSRPYLEFAVGLSESDFKKSFLSLKQGDFVFLQTIKSKLVFRPEVPAVMIAGGIGITPFRSMIQQARESSFQTPVWLLYGNRSEIPFEEELNGYAQNSDRFKIVHTMSRPPSTWQGRVGRVDEKLLREVVPTLPPDAHYYVVANPEMIADTKTTLAQLGIPPERISTEAFPGYAPKAATPANCDARVGSLAPIQPPGQ